MLFRSAVDQASVNNRQEFHRNGQAAWMADIPKSSDKYLALFNLSNEKRKVAFDFEIEMLRGKYKVRDLWSHRDLGTFPKTFGAELDAHGAGLYRLVKQ